MSRYSITQQEMNEQTIKFKNNYPKFEPYNLKISQHENQYEKYHYLIEKQNGPDFDDYIIDENHKIYRYLEKYFTTGEELLMVGCGAGREVLAALSIGLCPRGITLGSRNIEFATKYIGVPSDRICESIVEDLPFPSKSFNGVFAAQTAEHFIAPSVCLLEINRVLIDGGKLFLEWPPSKDFHGGDNHHHQICYAPGQMMSLLQKTGFGEIEFTKDNLESIPESDIWRCDQNYFLCVFARKIRHINV